MIRIALRRENGLYAGFEAKGHALFAPHGQDIVCAAVSILGCTCVNAMESVCGIIPEITENDNGVLAFQLPEMNPADNAKAQILMGALRQGLSDLADAYPQYVRLSVKNTTQN